MGLLRMLSRSAIICNGFFLLALLALHYREPLPEGLFSLIIITGLFLSVLLNAVVIVWWGTIRLRRREVPELSSVLVAINASFLLLQIIMLLK